MGKRLTPRQRAGKENRKKWKGFTPEGLEALRQSAQDNKPWEHSTGPRTHAGKERSRANAYQHGGRAWDLMPESFRQAVDHIREGQSSRLDQAYLFGAMRNCSDELFLRYNELLTRWGNTWLDQIGKRTP